MTWSSLGDPQAACGGQYEHKFNNVTLKLVGISQFTCGKIEK